MMNFELKNFMKGEEYRTAGNLVSVPDKAERPWRVVEAEFIECAQTLIDQLIGQ